MITHFLNTGPSAGPLLVGLRMRGAAAALMIVPPTARGNIDTDQIQVASRTGDGSKLLTWTTIAPVTHTTAGVEQQIAYDAFGNFYWCYAANKWARIGPGGYSNTF
jgi:hypothetical protein